MEPGCLPVEKDFELVPEKMVELSLLVGLDSVLVVVVVVVDREVGEVTALLRIVVTYPE